MCDAALCAVLNREEIRGLLRNMLARSSPGAFSPTAGFSPPTDPLTTDTDRESL
jgi:hypothetical protein